MKLRGQNANAYFFLTPFLLVFCAFWIWPILHSLSLSFQNTRFRPAVFDLSANWGRLAIDPAFANALKNTLIIMGVQVPIMIVLAIILAMMLNSPLLRAKGIMRFAFFAPVVVSEVAYAAVFRLIFNADFGIINKMLDVIGIDRIAWFSDPTAAMALRATTTCS